MLVTTRIFLSTYRHIKTKLLINSHFCQDECRYTAAQNFRSTVGETSLRKLFGNVEYTISDNVNTLYLRH